jgi:hypothetical protein
VSTGDDPAASTATRLNGWKEISNHLGKSVRTVQRWEREYALPVHRIGKEGGEIVFAFREEIDQWSRRSAPKKDDPQANRTAARLPRLVLAGAALTFLAGTGLAFWLMRPGGQPVSASVEGRELIVRDGMKRSVWTKPLDFEPAANNYQSLDTGHGLHSALVTDLDRDGSNEVVLGIHSSARNEAQGIRVFNRDGSIRFVVAPDAHVTFGSEEFAGPWLLYRLFVSDNPDGSRSLWAAFIHGLWFPSLLLEVDAAGKTKSEYWSNGYVESVSIARWAGKDIVLVGATNNDNRGASLAVFDYGNVRGSAPASQSRYACRTCGPGAPREFVIFPRRCIAKAMNGQATVTEAWIDKNDLIHVLVSEGPADSNFTFAAGVWYTLGRDLSVKKAEFTAESVGVHQSLEARGKIDHHFDPTDPRHGLDANAELLAVKH